jgi:hypothetical protein
MAVPNKKVNDHDTFIITAGSLGLSEEKFFEKLINMFPSELDFNKIRSPSEYLSFRNHLASEFMKQSDLETLKKISVALLLGPTTENNAELAVPAKPTTRQLKNKRSRVNKSSKLRAVAQLKSSASKRQAPWFNPKRLEAPPKRKRIGDPFLPTTPARSWVQHMPVVKFSGNYSWYVREVTTLNKDTLIAGSYATRSVKEEEYRHTVGCHTVDDECHLCDQVYRFHFFDDYERKTSRLIAFVALHHWINLKQNILYFNWCPQTWYEEACVDGAHIPASDVGALIKRYVESGKVQDQNQHQTHTPDTPVYTAVELPPPSPLFSFRLTR